MGIPGAQGITGTKGDKVCVCFCFCLDAPHFRTSCSYLPVGDSVYPLIPSLPPYSQSLARGLSNINDNPGAIILHVSEMKLHLSYGVSRLRVNQYMLSLPLYGYIYYVFHFIYLFIYGLPRDSKEKLGRRETL